MPENEHYADELLVATDALSQEQSDLPDEPCAHLTIAPEMKEQLTALGIVTGEAVETLVRIVVEPVFGPEALSAAKGTFGPLPQTFSVRKGNGDVEFVFKTRLPRKITVHGKVDPDISCSYCLGLYADFNADACKAVDVPNPNALHTEEDRQWAWLPQTWQTAILGWYYQESLDRMTSGFNICFEYLNEPGHYQLNLEEREPEVDD